jgi:ribosomal protein S20
MAVRIAEAHYAEKRVSTQASVERHLKDFRSAWRGLHKKWLAALSEHERKALDSLATEHERDAFRIVRSFERKASLDLAEDFPIVRDNLGDRLGISGKGAAGIRDKLEKLGIIQRTKAYVANKWAARYRWLLDTGKQVPAEGTPF